MNVKEKTLSIALTGHPIDSPQLFNMKCNRSVDIIHD